MHYVFGEYELDTDLRVLRRAGEEVGVQERAFDVLARLIEHREPFADRGTYDAASVELITAMTPADCNASR